ncbi:tetratricopeptide repeat protein [Actinoplanes sp. NPDC051470]|uniref:tetratricopeptide repeat protein n=1 Tax=Actinoplanes sp. NPDC051470 TaxID=3157224 RepID=UPI003438F829
MAADRVDVLIVVAKKVELDAAKSAALAKPDGGPGVAGWVESAWPGASSPYWRGTYRYGDHRELSVALVRQPAMGGRHLAPIATALVEQMNPRCLAMCGMCAGSPEYTDIGDVVVASHAYVWDEGRETETGFEPDLDPLPMNRAWLSVTQEFDPADLPSQGTVSPDDSKWWLLERLRRNQDPRGHPGRERYFAAETWGPRLAVWEKEGLIARSQDGSFLLAEEGRQQALQRWYDTVDGPLALPFRVVVAPMASGNSVVRNQVHWKRLANMGMRRTAGLDMECATIATVARERDVPHWLVIKGVADHGDAHKDDQHQPFASRAAAEVLYALLPELMGSSVPVSTNPSATAQLERDLPDLVGRDQFVNDLVGRLAPVIKGIEAQPAIVVLWGPGGVGKTTVATRIAGHLREGGAYLLSVNLNGAGAPERRKRSDDVVMSFLGELGDDVSRIKPEHRLARYRRHLAERTTVLLLDNASDAAHVRDLLPTAGRCVVILTSRRSLMELDGVSREQVTLLERDQGLELLRSVVGRSRVDAELEAATAVVDMCGGLPLAVRICANQLDSRPGRRFRWLETKLQVRRLPHLTAGERSVRAVIELSYLHLIGRNEQRAFRLLSLLGQGDLPVWALAALLDVGTTEADTLLDELIGAGLVIEVEHDGKFVRGRFHDLVRELARDLLRTEEPAAEQHMAVSRLADTVLRRVTMAYDELRPADQAHLALEVPESGRDWAAWVAEEASCLVEVVELADRFDLHAVVWRIACKLIPALEVPSLWTEWKQVNDVGLRAAKADGATHAYAELLRLRGDLRAWYLHSGDDAVIDLAKSMDILTELDDVGGAAGARVRLGEAYRFAGHRGKALIAMQAALAAFVSINDKAGAATALSSIGGVYRAQGQTQLAVDAFREALPILERSGDRRSAAIAMISLGDTLHLRAEWDEAMDWFARCRVLFDELGDARWVANTDRHIGQICLLCGRLDDAEKLFDDALAVFLLLKDKRREGLARWNIGELRADRGDLSGAMESLRTARQIFATIEDRLCEALTVQAAADAQTRLGSLDDANKWVRISHELSVKGEHDLVTVMCDLNRSALLVRAGRPDDARALADTCLTAARNSIAPRWEAAALVALGDAAERAGDPAARRRHLTAARDLYHRIQMPQAADLDRRLAEDPA